MCDSQFAPRRAPPKFLMGGQGTQLSAQCETYLLELLNGTLVDTTALVDQVSGGGRLAGIDVTND